MTERNGSDNGKGVPERTDRGNDLKRRHYLTAATGAASLSVAGCLETVGSISGGSGGEGPITVGVLAPNPDSDFIGRSIVRGAEIGVKHANENGGIGGRDVELVVGDTNSSPLEGRRQYQRLVLEEGADVTVGVFTSEVLVNIIDDIAEQETIHLTAGAATTKVSQLVKEEYDKYKYHFRVGPNNDYDLGRNQIDFVDAMAPKAGWESIAVIAEDYEWTKKPWEVYQDQLPETDLDVALERRYPPATDDFSSLYNDVQESGADLAFISTAHTGTAALLDWSYPNRPEQPPQPQPFAFAGIHVPMQLPAYYDLVDGACRFAVTQTSATPTSEITSKTQPFVQDYQAQFQGSNPVYTGYHAYDAVDLFAHAVEETGTLDSDELIAFLEDVSFDGSAGTVAFYVKDHDYPHDLTYNVKDNVYFQWQENDDGEGVQEIVWPEKHATTEYVTPPWL
ncbi:ABC transporter substrate-binding protein [Natrinema caseinilyticum]|uniref:ABC transporter substrate-binding protein n=1 Tax=Natrinema caseinilyticum TaxID=2961570 RepID=UPI0020C22253|nr:ABC transporter substrate-binding protein [Natrinema caseinilyticum]